MQVDVAKHIGNVTNGDLRALRNRKLIRVSDGTAVSPSGSTFVSTQRAYFPATAHCARSNAWPAPRSLSVSARNVVISGLRNTNSRSPSLYDTMPPCARENRASRPALRAPIFQRPKVIAPSEVVLTASPAETFLPPATTHWPNESSYPAGAQSQAEVNCWDASKTSSCALAR